MDLNIYDIEYLKNCIENKTKSSSGDKSSTDDKYFLYNNFLLSNETNLFNNMMSRQYILKEILDKKLTGDIIEFGIMRGTFSFQIMKTLIMEGINKKLYLFDFFEDEISMESEEEQHLIIDIYERLKFKRNSVNEIYNYANNIGFNNLNCIKGNIEKTIFKLLNENNKKFCFVYIDVDVDNVTHICLSNIWDRVVKNGIIVIDDYNSIKWGPFQNVDLFLKDKNVKITNLHNSINEGIVITKL